LIWKASFFHSQTNSTLEQPEISFRESNTVFDSFSPVTGVSGGL